MKASLARIAALAGTLAWLLAAWLAFSGSVPRSTGPVEELFLLDISASMRRRYAAPELEYQALLEQAAQRARLAQREWTWAAYADGVLEGRELALDSVWKQVGEPASDLHAALEFARARLARAPRAQLVIASDGHWTGRDPRPLLQELAQSGVGIEWWTLAPRTQPEALLVDVQAPQVAQAGEALKLIVRMAWAAQVAGAANTCTLRWEREDQPAQRLTLVAGTAQEQSVILDAGSMGAGPCRLQLSIEGSSSPAWQHRVSPLGAQRALHLGVEPLGGAWIWEAASPDNLSAALEDCSLVVSGAARLDPRSALALERFVARGGTWICCASRESFPHNWNAPFQDIQALEPSSSGSAAPEWLVLVDASGSMSGERWENLRQAWTQVRAALPASTRVSLRVFAAELEAPSERLPDYARGGPTGLLDALEQLAKEGSLASQQLLILSDGADRLGPAALARAQAWKAQHAANLRLAAIAIGNDVGRAVLEALVSDAAWLVDAPDLAQAGSAERLAALTEPILSGASWNSSTISSLKLAQEPSAASALLPIEGLQLHTHALLRARAGAQVLLESSAGAVVLARREHGAGQVLSCAFLPGALQGPGAEQFWASLAALARSSPSQARWVIEGEWAWLEAPSAPAPGSWLRLVDALGVERRAELGPLGSKRWGLGLGQLLVGGRAPRELECVSPSGARQPLPWPNLGTAEDRWPRSMLEPEARLRQPFVPRAGRSEGGVLVLLALGVGALLLLTAALAGFFSKA